MTSWRYQKFKSILLARGAVNSGSFIILFHTNSQLVIASIKSEGSMELFIVQAPQDCEVPRQDWSQWFCPVRFRYMGMQSPLSGLKNRFCLTSSKRGSFT